MGSEGHRTVHHPQAGPEHLCRACGLPVGTTMKRRKILGAWVPVWEPRPCRNPDCALYIAEAADESGKEAETG
ncbi:hypothetical protein [Streptomyces sp. NPDC051310]|uniref:hypothetical protein n=1 Tax=Streptomyces sp. NPDC051310 TaxID=3365649 RepID=UPI00378F09C1